MGEFRKKVGRSTLRARCAENLSSSAEWLLNTVASFAGQGKWLADGVIVQVGWSLLRLRGDDAELTVCEPDFNTNPFRDFRDDVTCTLTVLARQNLIHQRLGIERTPVRYDDKVVFKKGCLADKRVYAQRQEPGDGDSGWYLGPVEGRSEAPDASEMEARYVFQLLSERPCLLDIVALPEGYLVVFDGDTIEAILDPENDDVWAMTA